jgi:hypothetical protein
MQFVLPIIAAAAPAGDAATRASSALALFFALVFLLGLFMAGLVLIWAARRVRRTPTTKEPDDPPVDPWKESARRIEPYVPDDSTDDDEPQ